MLQSLQRLACTARIGAIIVHAYTHIRVTIVQHAVSGGTCPQFPYRSPPVIAVRDTRSAVWGTMHVTAHHTDPLSRTTFAKVVARAMLLVSRGIVPDPFGYSTTFGFALHALSAQHFGMLLYTYSLCLACIITHELPALPTCNRQSALRLLLCSITLRWSDLQPEAANIAAVLSPIAFGNYLSLRRGSESFGL